MANKIPGPQAFSGEIIGSDTQGNPVFEYSNPTPIIVSPGVTYDLGSGNISIGGRIIRGGGGGSNNFIGEEGRIENERIARQRQAELERQRQRQIQQRQVRQRQRQIQQRQRQVQQRQVQQRRIQIIKASEQKRIKKKDTFMRIVPGVSLVKEKFYVDVQGNKFIIRDRKSVV